MVSLNSKDLFHWGWRTYIFISKSNQHLLFARILACHLFGAKPLARPMLVGYQWDIWGHKWNGNEIKIIYMQLYKLKMSSANWWTLLLCLNLLFCWCCIYPQVINVSSSFIMVCFDQFYLLTLYVWPFLMKNICNTWTKSSHEAQRLNHEDIIVFHILTGIMTYSSS